MKKIVNLLVESLEVLLIALVIVIPVRYFVFQPFIVDGASMEPNLHDGDYLIVDEFSYHFREPERGEVIIFKYPRNHQNNFVKRVVGLPGETIFHRDNSIVIREDGHEKTLSENYLSRDFDYNFATTTLSQDEYFAVGDNRIASYDSRNWGPVEESEIIGRFLIKVWPFSEAHCFNNPYSQVTK